MLRLRADKLPLQALSTTLHPARLYANGAADAGAYELRAVICFYGSHYASFARTDEPGVFAFMPSSPVWTRFDDAAVTELGSWEAVCAACAKGHLQPTVLFYERV